MTTKDNFEYVVSIRKQQLPTEEWRGLEQFAEGMVEMCRYIGMAEEAAYENARECLNHWFDYKREKPEHNENGVIDENTKAEEYSVSMGWPTVNPDNVLDYDTFKRLCMHAADNAPAGIRRGQNVFNFVDYNFGTVARDVQFTDNVDCFFDDDEINNFIEKAWTWIDIPF